MISFMDSEFQVDYFESNNKFYLLF